ncbi:methylcobamide:CoM methyltransferase MtbA [Anaerosalibacter massiliensis]|uniref:MtaA/CmuA family methyltransferase n=1 Tax=Anaerosalibacter massiliensis TaxID=1347392 RepID=A0A9X2MJA1_9FIRM|nr:methylcobamide:CoM methyltransferase MtbA [Anaerosalibacter massiliensis]MCR2044187.1 MtaA/CmuA family methyltransferase [Anaerosalibacter massiliensis]
MTIKSLSKKERLFRAIKREKIDRPPCICPGGMMNMIIEDIMDITKVEWPEAHRDAEMMAKLTMGVCENGGFENFGVPFCMTVEAESMGATVGLGTKINEPRVIEYPINSVTEWKNLKELNLNKGRTKVVLDAIKILKSKNSDVPIIANLVGPVSTASSLMEPVDYYKELRKKPKEAHEFMEFVTKNLICFAKAEIEAGADILAISDPSGTGEILGPKLFAEFAAPYLNKIVSAIKNYTPGGTIIHICGKLKSVYGILNSLDSDVISFDSIANVKEVANNVNNKAIMGNVSTLALEKSSPDIIKNLSRGCIKSGVNILSPACGIGPRTKLENIQSMVEVAKESASENIILKLS